MNIIKMSKYGIKMVRFFVYLDCPSSQFEIKSPMNHRKVPAPRKGHHASWGPLSVPRSIRRDIHLEDNPGMCNYETPVP